MKKCCFIIPYFGNLPSYFPVFVKTCEPNKDFDWLIITDSKVENNLPNNVKIVNIKYKQFQDLVNKKMGFKCNFFEFHKLCDYKPAYGYIFEDYIKNYKFWGHCDIDIIIGDMNKFITDEMLESYDKVFCLGHMILYKNTPENNRMFMKEYKGEKIYKEVFTSPKTLVFDETYGDRKNINSIFEEYKKPIFTKDLSFNIKIFPTKFIKTTFDYETYSYKNEKYKKAVYIWDNGKLKRYYLKNKEIIEEEYLYMHLQERNMKIDFTVLNKKRFKIIPNQIIPLEVDKVTYDNFKQIKKSTICFHTLTTQIKWKKKGIKKRIKWLKQLIKR